MEKEKIIEKLLARFKECPSQEFTVRELAEGLKMNDSVSFKFVVQAIAQMEHDKQITSIRLKPYLLLMVMKLKLKC